MKKILCLVLLSLTSCAALQKHIPRAKFEVCAFGVCAGADTREMVSAIGDATASLTGLVSTEAKPAADPTAK